MTRFICFIIFVTFASCDDSKKNLELEILNKELVCYNVKSEKDTVNVITYKVSNPTKFTYYFNNMIEMDELYINGVYKNGKILKIYDSNNIEIKYESASNYSRDFNLDDCSYRKQLEYQNKIDNEAELLGYDKVRRQVLSSGGYENFVIHPNETLYFEYYINITNLMEHEKFRTGFARLEKPGEYLSSLSVISDSSNYKNDLHRDILKSIKVNNYKIYHGVLTSKNKIPLKVF